jgi:TolB protein
MRLTGPVIPAVVAMAAALALAATPAHATFPGQPNTGTTAFHTNRDGNFEIYKMDDTGNNETRLTNNTASDLTPSWSVDGSKIAFVSNRNGNLEIYTMNADGSAQTRITTNTVDDAQPDWSPSGQLVFTSNRHGNYEIYKMNADGTNVIRLTNNAAVDSWAAWSPDGTKLAFQSIRDGDYDIYKMNADGTAQTNLTNNTALDEYPNWNSRGSRIFYDSNADGTRTDIWTTDLNGITNPWLGTDSATADTAPAPWPGGDHVVKFSAGPSGDTNIYSYCQGACPGIRQHTEAAGVDEFPDTVALVNDYARPKGASPMRIALVPAYKVCDANDPRDQNATHSGALNSLSCVPPTPESTYLTVGTPGFNGAPANSVGSVTLTVLTGDPLTAQNEADIRINVSDTDVRCVGVSGGCTNGAMSDYADDLRFDTAFRITDKSNGGQGSGTVLDLPFRFNIPCATTASTTIGSTCSINTTVNSLFGSTAITESRRGIWQQTDLVRLYDGGADGVASTTADNQLFQAGGLFVP